MLLFGIVESSRYYLLFCVGKIAMEWVGSQIDLATGEIESTRISHDFHYRETFQELFALTQGLLLDNSLRLL